MEKTNKEIERFLKNLGYSIMDDKMLDDDYKKFKERLNKRITEICLNYPNEDITRQSLIVFYDEFKTYLRDKFTYVEYYRKQLISKHPLLQLNQIFELAENIILFVTSIYDLYYEGKDVTTEIFKGKFLNNYLRLYIVKSPEYPPPKAEKMEQIYSEVTRFQEMINLVIRMFFYKHTYRFQNIIDYEKEIFQQKQKEKELEKNYGPGWTMIYDPEIIRKVLPIKEIIKETIENSLHNYDENTQRHFRILEEIIRRSENQ